jgi:Mor family transcriptional regulator
MPRLPTVSKAELIELQKRLVTDRAIAMQLGISSPAVHHLRKKYGIPSSRHGNIRRNEEIIEAYKQGATLIALGKKLNVWDSTINRILKKAGVERNRVTSLRISKAKLLKLQKTLVTDIAISKKLGCRPGIVFYWREKYGIPSTVPDNSRRDKKIIAALKKGASQVALGKTFKLTASRIHRILKDAGALPSGKVS